MGGPGLDGEQHAALRDAAKLARNPALVPELEKLVATYVRDRTELRDAPTLGQRHYRLRELADAFERLRRWAATDPWVERALQEIEEPPLPVFYGFDLEAQMANQARRFRVAASHYEPGDRRSADREPGGPLWRFCWGLAELWGTSGGYVGRGPKTAFQEFAGQVFAALSEEPPQRVLNKVAQRWQERAAALTAKAEKTSPLSFAG
jgi:hypothetical protein